MKKRKHTIECQVDTVNWFLKFQQYVYNVHIEFSPTKLFFQKYLFNEWNENDNVEIMWWFLFSETQQIYQSCEFFFQIEVEGDAFGLKSLVTNRLINYVMYKKLDILLKVGFGRYWIICHQTDISHQNHLFKRISYWI